MAMGGRRCAERLDGLSFYLTGKTVYKDLRGAGRLDLRQGRSLKVIGEYFDR
jgi:hypothetical protein